jgi:hypothetical protein
MGSSYSRVTHIISRLHQVLIDAIGKPFHLGWAGIRTRVHKTAGYGKSWDVVGQDKSDGMGVQDLSEPMLTSLITLVVILKCSMR